MIDILEAALKRTRQKLHGLDKLIRKQLGAEYAFDYIGAICDGKSSVHHECSSFERVNGNWFYTTDEIL